jgi:hypothetical protein
MPEQAAALWLRQELQIMRNNIELTLLGAARI